MSSRTKQVNSKPKSCPSKHPLISSWKPRRSRWKGIGVPVVGPATQITGIVVRVSWKHRQNSRNRSNSGTSSHSGSTSTAEWPRCTSEPSTRSMRTMWVWPSLRLGLSNNKGRPIYHIKTAYVLTCGLQKAVDMGSLNSGGRVEASQAHERAQAFVPCT